MRTTTCLILGLVVAACANGVCTKAKQNTAIRATAFARAEIRAMVRDWFKGCSLFLLLAGCFEHTTNGACKCSQDTKVVCLWACAPKVLIVCEFSHSRVVAEQPFCSLLSTMASLGRHFTRVARHCVAVSTRTSRPVPLRVGGVQAQSGCNQAYTAARAICSVPAVQCKGKKGTALLLVAPSLSLRQVV